MSQTVCCLSQSSPCSQTRRQQHFGSKMARIVTLVALVALMALVAGYRKCNPNPICIALYDPVCGSNGQTYSNDCHFRGARCENPHLRLECQGECPCDSKVCGVACPLYVDPVCGSDGITYSNSCFLGIETCHNPHITLRHKGQCYSR
ncbi:hypothetical protein Pmani_002083 [Petrolisthes manimaculis]|uniref:Kazal-like domain-containing protein n=1 Tax=Petrolisthes manimaculis TaxID=1843537 RepID=A0AAE1QKZ8_9EUCA|nr:hypothetical protein Pmani_002083 [Petrolisthes manimaculis]